MHQEEFTQLLNFYQGRGAASDQNELVQLLRETQALYGGVIPQQALEEIAQATGANLNTVKSRLYKAL